MDIGGIRIVFINSHELQLVEKELKKYWASAQDKLEEVKTP